MPSVRIDVTHCWCPAPGTPLGLPSHPFPCTRPGKASGGRPSLGTRPPEQCPLCRGQEWLLERLSHQRCLKEPPAARTHLLLLAICVEQVSKPECFRALCFPVPSCVGPWGRPLPCSVPRGKMAVPQSPRLPQPQPHSLCETPFKVSPALSPGPEPWLPSPRGPGAFDSLHGAAPPSRSSSEIHRRDNLMRAGFFKISTAS